MTGLVLAGFQLHSPLYEQTPELLSYLYAAQISITLEIVQ